MCLAALTVGQSERFPVVLASNRDEFFTRASQPLAWWRPSDDAAPILSGRDLTGGGTWLGLNAAGRLALVTNVREPGRQRMASPSRGELVLQCLTDPQVDLAALAKSPRNGFNLLTVDLAADLSEQPDRPVGHWVSNRPAVQGREIGAGAFGLSNAALDTPWPKVSVLKQRLIQAVDLHHELDALVGALFAALLDAQPASDANLPRTGVSTERERQLSSAFIHIAEGESGAYGTRCSTVVVVEALAGRRSVHVLERTHDATGREAGMHAERFELPLSAEPVVRPDAPASASTWNV
jgi:uncharacterized protein with NRDE domain